MHILEDPWPAFFDLMDEHPQKAMLSFCDFLTHFMTTCPPSNISAVPLDRRDDLVSYINLRCIENDFRKLRQYRQQGSSFAAWFSIVVRREIGQFMRDPYYLRIADIDTRTHDALPAAHTHDCSGQSPEAETSHRILLDAVRSCLSYTGIRCRKLLLAAAEELLPREMGPFIGEPQTDPKKLSDDLRFCRSKLRKCITAKGFEMADELEPG